MAPTTIAPVLTGEDRTVPPPAAAPRRRRRPPSTGVLFGVGFALIAWILELRPLIDNSFFWHLQTGHWILDHGIPRHDIFSFSAPGAPWVVQSWLAEAFYAVVDNVFGAFGLRILRALTCGLISFLTFRLAARIVGDTTRATLLTFAALAMSITVWSERPLLLGVLAMLILIWVVEVPDSLAGRHPLVVVPPLMWLWANSHGSFALGFAYLALHLTGRRLDGAPLSDGRERTLLVATVVAVLACLANPLGLSLLTFPVELLSRSHTLQQIREWRSPDFHSVMGMLFGLWIVAWVIGIAGGRLRCSRRDLLVGTVFLLLGLWALRNLVVAPLVGLPIVGRAVALPARPGRRPSLNWVVLALLVALGGLAVVEAAGQADYDFSGYPVKAMQAVQDQGLLGRHLLTTDAWAGYVIHAYWPQQSVFLDDRYDMYPTSQSDDYFDLRHGKADWQAILDKYRIDVIVWDKDNPLSQILDLSGGWRRVYSDDTTGVWVRKGSEQ
jgi:hypothetical protein